MLRPARVPVHDALPAALPAVLLASLSGALASPTPASAQTAEGAVVQAADRAALRTTEQDAAHPPAQAAAEGGTPSSDGPPTWSRDVALFAGLVGFDPALRGVARALRRDGTVNQPAGIAEYFGDWQAVLPAFAAGSALVGGVTQGSTGLGKTLAILGGVFAGSMANEALNRAVGRRRPLEGRGAYSFDPFHGHASFPSGHAAFAFSMAGGVDAATEHWFPAAAAYTLAAGTAASRVHDGKHWVSDVVVGAAVGSVVSRWTTRRLMDALGIRDPDDEGPDRDDGLVRRPGGQGQPGPRSTGLLDRVRPVASPGFVGVSIRF